MFSDWGLIVHKVGAIFPRLIVRGASCLTTNCHVFSTNHIIKYDYFKILATGRSDMHCKIKESLFIRGLKPALNENVGSEKLYLYYYNISCRFMSINFVSSQSVQLYF